MIDGDGLILHFQAQWFFTVHFSFSRVFAAFLYFIGAHDDLDEDGWHHGTGARLTDGSFLTFRGHLYHPS